MSAEDKLAALLREEADSITPSGDGLQRIRRRVAARRRTRWLLLPSAAVATAAAVSGFFVLGGTTPDTALEVPGASSTPTATASAAPTPSSVGSPFVPAIWPFASEAQADAWRTDPSSKPWAGSNLDVAQHFLDDYLKLDGLHLVQECVSCDVVELRSAEDRAVGTVTLVREDDGTPRAYSVAGVTFGDGFVLTAPAEGAKVTSPLTVSGTIVGVDESVRIDLLSQSGQLLGRTYTSAGTGQPWTAQLTWTRADWYTGSLVLTTTSAKDGSINRVLVSRVVRG